MTPFFPRLTGTCCTAWGWSRRRVRRVSYLSPRAEIVVVFLAEGVQDIKVAGKKTFFSCEISFVGVIFFINSQSCFYPPPSLSPFLYLSLQSRVRLLCEREQIIYLSGLSVCDCVSFFFHIVLLRRQVGEQERQQKQTRCDTESGDDVRGVVFVVTAARERLSELVCFILSHLFLTLCCCLCFVFFCFFFVPRALNSTIFG